MIVALVDCNGNVIMVTDSDDPIVKFPTMANLNGELVKVTRRILRGCERVRHDKIVEHMKVKHDEGDGSVTVESDGKDT